MTPEALREHRKASHRTTTQSELAETLGVASNTVARWERGKLPIPTWVGRMLTLTRQVDRLERALLRARRENARLRTQLEGREADRKRVAPRRRS